MALEQEKERCQQAFSWSYNLYMDTCENILISKSCKSLISNQYSGLSNMINCDKFQEIQDLFELLSRRKQDNIDIIADQLKQYIIQIGYQINTNESLIKDPKEYIKEIIKFYKKIDLIVQNYLNREQEIQLARSRGFQDFLNKFEKAIFYLAKHCDFELRIGMKGNSEQEIEEKMQDIINILLCFYSRDGFILHYSRFLSNRLLTGSSLSDENEKRLITQIKKEIGKSTTNKLTEMCTDIQISQTIMAEIKKKMRDLDSSKCNEIDWKITVLANAHWQIQPETEVQIPQELKWICENYIKIYLDKHKGRNIKWAFSQGSAEIYGKFDKKYTLDQDIEIGEYENLKINNIFAHKLFKIKMHPTQELRKTLKQDKGNSQSLDDQIDIELKKIRDNQLDACIVRIMKSRKHLKLNELNQEVVKLMSHIFKPQPQQIKQRIESLIEREYLTRSDEDRYVE
ncbi:hypothetical protein IMG5_032160 [Ichthyophthirius multifiliis]|uniref:Cullin family profile domain-containing protein n=1 Tax=Ichthyophthirius multifiliis TaxID=5932 RepID=G0QLK8_ICHMU|nr:hypothetical protein IMG5_032160 [Ichthyophthirius multifiliis]EGR33897.1 hypothetical protein IMG5_032160 [Ichthyophthirius multifiliis]|eukprot:XP_004039199.1 hypothetical protein IMG5_032160 [Ichthyophthirius multifiliis]